MKNNIWDLISLTLFYIFFLLSHPTPQKREYTHSQNSNYPITETKVIFKHSSQVHPGWLSCPYKTASLDGTLEPKIVWENTNCFCLQNTLRGSKSSWQSFEVLKADDYSRNLEERKPGFEMWNVCPRSIELANSSALDSNEGFWKLASLLSHLEGWQMRSLPTATIPEGLHGEVLSWALYSHMPPAAWRDRHRLLCNSEARVSSAQKMCKVGPKTHIDSKGWIWW